ncbi:Putative zinc-or iron-chelating domain-containing protein [Malonomonas rubra DSM 5091]|uniref:Putative zinc-or iron-chelating domain-containing protein n=1 Tax=Malonomonas rubra DSM 5091 TaxID=1122189 RepID=A0A1M6EAC0_MALRU|nr:YkgJ family cysteine cluster protein [Malonomonas rubra]SHI82454.1 Putative zinc-or iron-chelating domain-containing protein [Malonomonas rubra DSM 5091]
MESFDFVQYQGAISEAVARSCQSKDSVKPILQRLQTIAVEAEREIELHPSDRSHIDCGPGCSSCCVVSVSTLMPEGIAIASYLRGQGRECLQQAAERLDRLWYEVRGLDDEERLYVRRSCAFLDEAGHCTIYPVRPLLCRSVSSTSAIACRDALAGKVLGEETPVLMHQFQQSLYESLFSGVAAGLQQCGLDERSFQLAGLIRYLLKTPQAEQEWLNGKRLTWQDLY